MSKIFNIISVFLLWLAATATIAHLIIPHDHHLLESTGNQEESCPYSKNTTGHHSGFPMHCHAFNEFAAEKFTTFIVKEVTYSHDLSFDCHSASIDIEVHMPLVPVFGNRERIPDSYLLKIPLLRAPPSLS
jgi:hypothetical protein